MADQKNAGPEQSALWSGPCTDSTKPSEVRQGRTSLQRPLMVIEMMHRTVGTPVSVRCRAFEEVIHVRLKSPEIVFKTISKHVGYIYIFLNPLFILNRHWHMPVFFVYPALHLDLLVVLIYVIVSNINKRTFVQKPSR